MAEPIEMSFRGHTPVGLTNHVLDGDVCWWNLANMVELSVCNANAALHQSTLTTCYYHHYYYWQTLTSVVMLTTS